MTAVRRQLLLAGLALTLAGCSWWHALVPAIVPASAPANLSALGLRLLRAQPAGNAIVAPYSVAAGLDLLRAGAGGVTADQITALAGPPARTTPQDEQVWQAAQRLWVTPSAPLKPAFLAQASERGADVAALPASPEDAINAWAWSHTAGKIDTLLPPGGLPADTQLVLTSAAHFKAAWRQPFAPARTVPAPFHNADGSMSQPLTMAATVSARTGKAGRYQLLELAYAGGRYAMLIGLPDGAPGNPVDAALTGSQLAAWRDRLQPATVELHLPRFRIGARGASIKAALQQAGMVDAFSRAADFSPMTGTHKLVLGDLVQAAAIEVDERGTQAVAAGAAVMVPKSLVLPTGDAVRVDRPFLFALIDNDSGALLFLGAVSRLGD